MCGGEPSPAPSADIPDLDAGETKCSHLALSVGRDKALVLIDERAGRAVATEAGIKVDRTAAVIGLAKKRRLVDSAKSCFARLHATDFRISAAVIQAVLHEVGEI